MTVLLILATFVVFLMLDYFLFRKRATAPAVQPAGESVPRTRPPFAAGFKFPENLRYHLGHTWALAESPQLVRVGLDDFAARFIGRMESITLPRRGQWVRQGQKIWTVERSGKKTEMVSPVEGIVTDINEAAVRNPQLALHDPYGNGWLVTVQAPDAKTTFRNLLGGNVARRWMEEAAARLRGGIPALAGALAQDGGLTVEDVGALLSEEKWNELASEFFLS